MNPVRTPVAIPNALDAWSDYCVKSDELAMLILESQDKGFTSEIRTRIARKRAEIESILNAMIGGQCPKPTESKNIGSPISAKDA